MIGWLKGHIVDRHQPGQLVLDVHGVGYDVEISLSTFFTLETHTDMVELLIHTVVREDAFLLYGFLHQQERLLFRALIKVNGVGPKLAMAILSSISPDEFIQTIQQQDALVLTQLPGIGKKTAERLLVEMKDRINDIPRLSHDSSHVTSLPNQQHEAISALEVLGYKRQEASKIVQNLDDGHQSCEQLIRQALQVLSR